MSEGEASVASATDEKSISFLGFFLKEKSPRPLITANYLFLKKINLTKKEKEKDGSQFPIVKGK